MPYYVYRVRPFAQLDRLCEFNVFTDASAQAKALRASGAAQDGRIQVIFAADPTQAEDLLCQSREPGPSGDE